MEDVLHDDGEGQHETAESGADHVEDLDLDEPEGTAVTGGVLNSFLWVGSRGSGPSGSS